MKEESEGGGGGGPPPKWRAPTTGCPRCWTKLPPPIMPLGPFKPDN